MDRASRDELRERLTRCAVNLGWVNLDNMMALLDAADKAEEHADRLVKERDEARAKLVRVEAARDDWINRFDDEVDAVETAEEHVRDVLHAGTQTGNTCFNLKQRDHLKESERRSCSESVDAWDTGTDNARAWLKGRVK